MKDQVIGVDLGGTQTRAVLATHDGTVIGRHVALTDAHEGPTAVIQRICEQVRLAAADRPFAAIGIGAPGPTDPYEGVVLMAPNMAGWHNVNLHRALESVFEVPVFVGNDANLAGLAEHRYGAGRGCSDMVYMTVSTGIGGGVIVDNRMLLGRQGLAAEIGHVTIDISAEDRGEVTIGTLEGLASGPNIARRARQALSGGASSVLRQRLNNDISALTPKLLNEAARDGDDFSLHQFRIAGRYLGIGLVNLLHTFNPQRFVIGGSIWLNCRPFMDEAIWETIKDRCNAPEYWRDLQIVSAELGDDVGLLGAVALAVAGLERAAH